MDDDGRARRRATAVAVALLLLVAAFVVLTLRCASKDDEGRRAPETEASPSGRSIDGASDDARSGEGSTSDVATSAARDAAKTKTAPRRRPTADESTEAANSASSASRKPAPKAANDARSRSPFGRFALVGDSDPAPQRGFGQSVAIDGDVAVIGAPGFKRDDVACGAAYVFERKDDAWTQTTRLDSPRPDVHGFAWRVGVTGVRVVVFDAPGAAAGVAAFRTYARNADGAWVLESEVPLSEPLIYDCVVRGDTAAVGVNGAVLIWRRGADGWKQVQRIKAPEACARTDFGVWLSLAGDTLAVDAEGNSGKFRVGSFGSGSDVYVYRRKEDRFELEPTLVIAIGHDAHGTLAHGGAALVWMWRAGPPLYVDERKDTGWTRTLARWNGFRGGSAIRSGEHSLAGDGDLVVGAARDWTEFVVLHRRDDGWYRTSMAPAKPRDWAGGKWPAWHPNVAISGRSIVVGTEWDGVDSGRAWFFDVTDEDLARATKIESDAK